MKTNNIPTSGKYLAKMLALCLTVTFSSCNRDETESVDFGVKVQTPDAIYAGQPVTFEFEGNPDYIVFTPVRKTTVMPIITVPHYLK